MWRRRKSPRADAARIAALEVELGLRPSPKQLAREQKRLERLSLDERIMAVAEKNQPRRESEANQEDE